MMLKFLLPVDGSDTSNRAVAQFIKLLDWYKEAPEIHLLNVQFPQHGNVPLFIGKEDIDIYHREEGLKALQTARGLLEQANIACKVHVTVGNPWEMITGFAKEIDCAQIVIGPRGLGIVKGLLLGSVASKVMQFTTVPVLLVK